MDAAEVIKTLEANHRNSALQLGQRERALIQFACQYLQHVGYEGTLVRHVAYFLSLCDARLSATAIALITDRTDRNVREIAGMDTEAFRKSVTFSPKENAGRQPKISPRLVPVLTEYLLTHRVTSKREILRFLEKQHQVSVCFNSLDAVLKQYGLERLIERRGYRREAAEEAAPLFSVAPGLPARG
ncbi:MAG: hypothetical protein V3V75_09695 [Thermoguttaceae bacterium]